MQCPTCARTIPEESRFCLYCGTTLEGGSAPRRPSLDGLMLLRNYIPHELAERILAAGKQIESERRLVTIVFADVTGFTALSERMDPEDLSAILNECFSGLISVVLKYEGTIDKFIGDGIMAIFGAPLAHENDPERAVRCAVDMVADIERFNATRGNALGGPLGLHVGLHSGMVIAGNVGSDLRMDYSVIGDTVNLASRLVEIAPRGQVYLSADTQKLVADIVNVEGPVSSTLRGKPTPVLVYHLLSIKNESDRRVTVMGQDNFVGRLQELEEIERSLDRVLHKDQSRLGIRGEPGVGKSRLKAELVKMAYQKGIFTVEGACSSFETTTPYYVWSVLLKNLLKIKPDATVEHIRERLGATLAPLALQEHEPYLATLLSVRFEEIMMLDEKVRKQRIFQAVRSLLSTLSIRRPMAFILEDLHWIDRFSQELLEFIFVRGSDAVLSLFVVTFRNEYQHVQTLLDGGALLDLNRLSSDDARRLILFRLNAETIPLEVEEFILRRSEGNPFFIQEIIKTLLDKRIIAVKSRKVSLLAENIEASVPSTIQGIIMARIDRLQDSIKELLFGASAIGREFSRPLLERVIGGKADIAPSLTELRSLELILEKDEAREFEYLFKHFLIQEVAYNTMLGNKRKELHASIARAIEQLYPDRLMEYYELLAFHYEKAELWDKAAEYLSRSGHKVRQMYSREESENFFERKELAVKKLYQSAGAQAGTGAKIKAILPPLFALLVPIITIFGLVRIVGKAQSEDVFVQIIVGALSSLLLVWYTLTLWYLGVVPFLRGRPTLYDLMEDRIRVMFKDNTSLSVHFSEIEFIHLWDAKANAIRPMKYRLLDPLGRMDALEPLTFRSWFRRVFLNILPPYSFGVGSGQTEIHIRLYTGATMLRLFLPWYNTAMHSRVLGLHPSDTKEFYVQCEVALMKWGKQQI
jgi:class 3 adenylate cyclase